MPAGAGGCLRCGEKYPPGAKFCPECGWAISSGGPGGGGSAPVKSPVRRRRKSVSEDPESLPEKSSSRKTVKIDPEDKESPLKKRTARNRVKIEPEAAPAEKEGAGKDGGDDAKGKDDLGCGGWCIVLAVLAAVISTVWYLLTSFPRTSFWIAAPIIGWYTVSGIGFKGGKAVLSILLLTGIVWWGLWAHSAL